MHYGELCSAAVLQVCKGKQHVSSRSNSGPKPSYMLAMQDKLLKHQESHSDTAGSQTWLGDLDAQLEAAEQRILSLKKAVLQHDTTIHKLLHMSVGAA